MLVPWESFRETIEAVVLTPEDTKKSKAGRKPIDAMVMFRMLILQSLYNLSDDQAEYQVGDRLSFTRFLTWHRRPDFRRHDAVAVPREAPKAGLIGLVRTLRPVSGGQGLYCARRADGRRDDRGGAQAAQHARGERRGQGWPTPQDRAGNPRNRQKDKDARWTKKHGKSFFGYKNHVNADARHKLIHDYDATDASVHDSQKLDGLLNTTARGTCTPTAPIAPLRPR